MTQQRDIIEVVKELSERCDSSSHLSEELDNARISPSDLADALLTKDEQLKITREALEQVRYYIDFAPTKEEGAKEAYRQAVKALELISSH